MTLDCRNLSVKVDSIDKRSETAEKRLEHKQTRLQRINKDIEEEESDINNFIGKRSRLSITPATVKAYEDSKLINTEERMIRQVRRPDSGSVFVNCEPVRTSGTNIHCAK